MADFSKLPVGTLMVVHYGHTGRYLRPIEKMGKRHFICGSLKWQTTGWNSLAAADKWSRTSINIASPEVIAEIRHAERAEYLRTVPWLRLPAEVVERICTEASAEVGKLLAKEAK